MLFDEDHKQFEELRAERHAQFGVTIEYIKSRVGQGMEYENEIARAVFSETGAYYQLHEMPEEFSGALGECVTSRFVREAEALQTLQQIEQITHLLGRQALPIRGFSFYALYAGGNLRAQREMFVCDYNAGRPPFIHGAWQPNILPRFFKLRLQLEGDDPCLTACGLTNGVHFFLAPHHTADSRYLMGTLEHKPSAIDLNLRPATTVMN